MKKKESFRVKFKNALWFIGLNSVQVGIQFCYSTLISVAIPFFAIINNQENPNGVYGIAQITIGITGSIVGMIITLCVCGWSDRCTFSFGRRRIFIFIGVVFVLISVIFLITSEMVCDYCHSETSTSNYSIDWTSNFLALIGLSFMQLGTNFMSEPSRALIPDFINYQHQQIAYFYNAALGAIAGLVCNVIGGGIMALSNDYYYSIIFGISLVAVIISVIPTLFVADEERFIPTDQDFKFKRFILAPIIDTYEGIKQISKELIIIYIIIMFSWIAYYPAALNMTIYYAKDVFHIEEQNNDKYDKAISVGMFSNALFWFVQVISPLILPTIEEYYGRVPTYLICNIFSVIGYGILSIAPFVVRNEVSTNPSFVDGLVICSCFIAHAFTALQYVEMNSLPFSFMKKFVSTNMYAIHLGLINVFITFGQIISMLIAAGLLQIDVWAVMAFSSICFTFVSFLSILFFFVDKKAEQLTHQEMQFETTETASEVIFG